MAPPPSTTPTWRPPAATLTASTTLSTCSTEPARGRYVRLHDLLREHARALAMPASDDPADRDAAVSRLLDFYLHTALAASRHITERSTAYHPLPPGHPPACAPQLATPRQAIAWLEAEQPNLHAAASHAAARAQPQHAVAIPAAMGSFLRAHGHWDQAAALHQVALTVARQAGDRPAQASALVELGVVQHLAGDYPAAAASHQQALALYHDLGDRYGQAYTVNHLGTVQRLAGDYPAAAASNQQALALYRDLDNPLGQAFALGNLGIAQRLAGDYPAAAASHQQALALFRHLDSPYGQAFVRHDLGVVQWLTEDYPAAAASLTEALALYRDIGDRGGQAEALNSLGELLSRTSTSHRARDHHTQGARHRPRHRHPPSGSTRPGRNRPKPSPGRQPRRRHVVPAAGTHDLPAHRSPGQQRVQGNPSTTTPSRRPASTVCRADRLPSAHSPAGVAQQAEQPSCKRLGR